jgi:DNA polymerase III sliding clamp (beta) subunit (PCNA family)
MKTSVIKSAINTLLSPKGVLPILNFVKIDNNELTVTDLHTTLIIKNIGLDGNFCVDAKQYLNVLSLCENFTTSVIDTKVYFESGKDIFGYPIEIVDNYPHIPRVDKFEPIGMINAVDLARINSAAKFVSTDKVRPCLLNVAITKGLIAATDGHKLFFEQHKIAPGVILNDILINKKTCKLLELFNIPVIMGAYKNECNKEEYLKFDNIHFTIIQRIVNERYPDILAVIPTDNNKSCTVDKKLLSNSLNKALTCANKITSQIKFHINGALGISAEDINVSTEFNTTIESVNTGEVIDIGFNGKLVQSVIDEIDSKEITFTMSEPNSAAIFNGNIVLMPVKL